MYYWHMGYFGLFGMVLFWGIFIWIIIWLINLNKKTGKKEIAPLQIAKERYARGELTKKEYEEMKKELS